MVSEKRLEANRANARKSTGPRTPEGKARSRANGLKHGLTGAGVVLAGEDGPAVAERVEAWAAELHPRGEVEHWLVARAATASVRLDRCVRRECAKIDQAVRQAAARWDGDAARDVRFAVARLAEDPAAGVAELRCRAAGCDWLLGRWDTLRRTAAAAGALELPQLRHALRLMGRATDPTATEPGAATALWGFGLAALRERDLEDVEHYYGLSPAGDATDRERIEAADAMLPDDPIGRDGLMAAIDEQVARLTLRRDDIWNKVEGPDRAATIDRVRFDATPEAALMRRYETAATTDLHRAFDRLARVRKEGLAEVEDHCDADAPAQDEPNGEPIPTPPEDPSPRSAIVAVDPSPSASDTSTQDEPTREPETPPTPARDEPNGEPEPTIEPEFAAAGPRLRSFAPALPIVLAWLTLFAASGGVEGPGRSSRRPFTQYLMPPLPPGGVLARISPPAGTLPSFRPLPPVPRTFNARPAPP